MDVGWAPRWTGQTERTSLLTVGVALPLSKSGYGDSLLRQL
jgi:hypothetical protein